MKSKKARGWTKAYNKAIGEGDGLEKVLRVKWVSIFGDVIRLEHHHDVEIDGVTVTPKRDIEDIDKRWWITMDTGERYYTRTRKEAYHKMRELVNEMYSDDEIDERLKEINFNDEEWKMV